MASAKPSAFSDETRLVIFRRSDGRCDRCGLRVHDKAHFHHRNPRRMGGSGDERLGLPSNGMLLHPGCHDFIESHRKIAAQLGFLMGSLSDPAEIPVFTGWARWVWLLDDGGYLRIIGVPPLHPSGPPTRAEPGQDASESDEDGGDP